MRAWSRLALATVAALLFGVGLMMGFDASGTRIIGVLCLLAFIVLGVFLIATPEYLSLGDSEENPDSVD